jgi:hypothetical protein
MDIEEYSSLYESLSKIVGEKLPDLSMPSKFRNGLPTKDALVLVYLFKHMGKPISKSELTSVVRAFHPETNDVQQARHLGKQKGFYIISSTRGDLGIAAGVSSYSLKTLESAYPGFSVSRRSGELDFEALKLEYENRCATCGSPEGQRNFLNRSQITKLEEGHIDPRKPLDMNNCIPQCSICNRAYRDWFIFDDKGRVRDVNPESPRWRDRLRSDDDGWENLAK